MGTAGLVGLGGGAPVPDAERVAAIRFSILDDADTCAGFAEPQRAALAAIHQQQDDDPVASALAASQAALTRIKADVDALDVTTLEPRKGLAGMFDSRAKRLKAFRAAYGSAASAATQMAGDIHRHGKGISDRSDALSTLWDEARDAIIELDAHIAAARAWLADKADTGLPAPEAMPDVAEADDPPETPSGQTAAAANETGEPEPDADPAPGPTAPHRLAMRVEELESSRTTAVARLAELRAAQNAVHGVLPVLTASRDQVEVWCTNWTDALGLSGRKPRKVKPEAGRLVAARDTLVARISAALGDIGTAMERRSEITIRGSKVGPKAEDGTASQA